MKDWRQVTVGELLNYFEGIRKGVGAPDPSRQDFLYFDPVRIMETEMFVQKSAKYVAEHLSDEVDS